MGEIEKTMANGKIMNLAEMVNAKIKAEDEPYASALGYGSGRASLSMDGISESENEMDEMKAKSCGTPPFGELQKVIESAGYRVISIGAEHSGMRFSGAINLQIAPASWAEKTDYINFPQVSRDFLAKNHECAAQCRPQGRCTD